MRQLLVIGIVTLYMILYSDGNPTPNSTVTSLSDPSEQLVVNLIRRFSSDFFQGILENAFETRFSSPLNIFIIEYLLSYGARGVTRTNYLSTIGLPEDKTEMAKLGYKNFVGKLNNYDVQMKMKLYVQSNFTLDPYFSKISTEEFSAEIEPIEVDEGFIDSSKISKWVSAQTNKQVLSDYSPTFFGCDPSLIAVNTMNFKGTWKVGFNSSRTAFRDFFVNGGLGYKTPTMHTRGNFRHGQIDELDAHFIELPFKSDSGDNAVSMFIIMSNNKKWDDWQEMPLKLRNFDRTKLLNSTEKEMEVSLPKFWFKTSQGPEGAFEQEYEPVAPYNNTNISGIFKTPRSSILSSSTSQTRVEIDEDGLEAAQSTVIAYSTRTCGICDDYKLRLDGCRQLAIEREEKCNKNAFKSPSNRKPRSAVPEFKVNRPFVGIIAMKGQIFMDLFTMNMPGVVFKNRLFRSF